jgi:hypothetical protein
MRKALILSVALCAVLALTCGCSSIESWFSNTTNQQEAATGAGEGAVYITLTVMSITNPSGVAQAATDIKDIATTIGTAAGTGQASTAQIILTLQDFDVAISLIPAPYSAIATALLNLIPASITLPTSDIPQQYLVLIQDFCTAAASEAAQFIPASAKLKALPPSPSLDPIHQWGKQHHGGG